MGPSNSPTRITHPSRVARPISTPASRSIITACRYSGMWSQYFATNVLITTASLANPFSTMRSSSGAAVTVGPLRHAHFAPGSPGNVFFFFFCYVPVSSFSYIYSIETLQLPTPPTAVLASIKNDLRPNACCQGSRSEVSSRRKRHRL